MTVAKGSHSIGPQDGSVLVNVYKEGMAAKMGHDLTMEAKSWSGKANLDPDNPAASSVQITIDPSSLEVVDAKGGAKALSDGDHKDIRKNMEKVLNTGRYNAISFESNSVSGSPPRLQLRGNLTIAGQSSPADLSVEIDDSGRVTATTSITHSQFGLKPFSKLGMLKVKDNVDITIRLQLPTS